MKTRKRGTILASQLIVRGLSAGATRGILVLGNLRFPCAIGRTGRTSRKREGDGSTPIGRFALRAAFYRADRLLRPRAGLPLRAIRPCDGWCDAPQDRNYNRPVRHPYPASAEHLWRADHLYDLVVVLGYNDHPRALGLGSAIFMHVAGPGFAPTEGCIALRRADLQRVLARLSHRTMVSVLS